MEVCSNNNELHKQNRIKIWNRNKSYLEIVFKKWEYQLKQRGESGKIIILD